MGAGANKTRARVDKIVAALKGKGEPIPVQVKLWTPFRRYIMFN